MPTSTAVYQLKVSMQHIKPLIWRRIQVPANITLNKLHRIVQIVMGWQDYHLYAFDIDGVSYLKPFEDDLLMGPMSESRPEKDSTKAKLNRVVRERGSAFLYRYDFGDNWEHEIVVEEILEAGPGQRYQRCIAGERACPPEDCGSVPGYFDLLTIMNNPRHREYKDRIAWLGHKYDPEKFDINAVNERLSRLR